MPMVTRNGVELYYVESGEGPETVVFSHSYLLDHRHFEHQIQALATTYRVIAYDHRDHGESTRASVPYGMYDLVDDAAAVIEKTGAGPCHWIGLSTGGFVGMRLALRYPHLLRSLTLLDTAAEGEPALRQLKYRAMFAVLRLAGTKPLISSVMSSLFGRSSLAEPSLREELATWRERVAALDPAAVVRFGDAIFSRDDVLAQLAAVSLPVLVMAGAEDRAVSPYRARRIAECIDGARFVLVPGAGHLITIESPTTVTDEITDFLRANAHEMI